MGFFLPSRSMLSWAIYFRLCVRRRRKRRRMSTLPLPELTRRLLLLLSSSNGQWCCTNFKHLTQIHALMLRTHLLFHSSFHFNFLLRSYTHLHSPLKALLLHSLMSRSAIPPDSYTLPISLKASSQLFALPFARQLHSLALKLALHSHQHCESGFISLYCKSGEFGDAYKLFDENPLRKLGSWNALIAGLSQGGRSEEAIRIFIDMTSLGLHPDDFTMTSVLSACGSLGDLNLALQLHKHVFHAAAAQPEPDTLMLNSLIDMYGKCGRMDFASTVFSRMQHRNVSSWTSMIVGYAAHGHADEALEFFRCMRAAGVRPNHVTFIGVLSACAHGGKVEEGRYYFNMMKNVYGMVPQMQHYGCMVDMLGRVGLLEEARKMVEEMPMRANVVIWGCLMGACEKYGDVEMGEWVAVHLRELEPWNDGVYVVLSNIYATRGLWQKVEDLRIQMKQCNLPKVPAYSLATDSN